MKADNLHISKVFSSGGDIHYVLPHFQREYTWEKENCKTLLEDALAVYDESAATKDGSGYGEAEHFLGSIVVIHDGMRSGTISAFKLVDGQQRLTTIALLLKVLSKLCSETHPALAKKLTKLLVNADEAGDLYFKILPTIKNGDRAAYCALIKDEAIPDNVSRIPQTFAYFEDALAARIKESLDPERLAMVVTNSFQVVFVDLDSKENPYRIFESLNAKGKPLTQADLVRNYIAMKLPAADQERVFQSHWRRVEELLQESRNVGRLPELTAFLRHYLAMEAGVLCDEQHVYARFRDRAERECPTSTAFEAELQKISRFAAHYDRLLRPDGIEDKSIETALSRLNQLEVATGYPFLLRVLDEHLNGIISKPEFLEILATLESYLLRRYVVGETSNYLTKMFPTLYGTIDASHRVPSLRRALASRKCPSNAAVIRATVSRRLYEKSVIVRTKTTLLLESINRHLSKGTGGYTVLDKTATIEHIMPQTLKDEWKEHLGIMWEQTHRDYLHVLGNLTLVTGEWNSALSNAPFAEKKPKLASNALRLNSDYFTRPLEGWGRQEIQSRGEELTAAILTLWPSLIENDESQNDLLPNPTHVVSQFHYESVERIAEHLNAPLKRISDSRYESSDGRVHLVGLCSKSYDAVKDDANFWFGFSFSQKEFLALAGEPWLALECVTPNEILLLPLKEIEPLLPSLNITEGRHWHIFLQKRGSKYALQLPALHDQKDVSGRLL